VREVGHVAHMGAKCIKLFQEQLRETVHLDDYGLECIILKWLWKNVDWFNLAEQHASSGLLYNRYETFSLY
jgi:hypothetical protein